MYLKRLFNQNIILIVLLFFVCDKMSVMNPMMVMILGLMMFNDITASPLLGFHIDGGIINAYGCESIDGKSVAYDGTCSEMPNAAGCNAGRQGLNCRFCGFSVFPACPGSTVDPDQPKILNNVSVAYIEGDIAIIDQTPDEYYLLLHFQNRRFQNRMFWFSEDVNNAITERRRLWSNAIVPYLITKSFSERERNVLLKAIGTLEEYTCIKFVQRTEETDYIHIFRGTGCFSLIGRHGGGQPLSIGYGCLYTGTVMHELMHALGLFHEQSRADRDEYVDIYKQNVLAGADPNFQKYTLENIDHLGEPYDVGSLMHYNNYAFSKNGEMSIAAKDGFELKHSGLKDVPTKIDAAKINKLYGCDPTELEPSTPAPTTTADPTPKCRDINPSCEGWARYGQCGSNKKYMDLACARSCSACNQGRSRICQDHADACPIWATKGECQITHEYMRVVCPLSCGHCVSKCNIQNDVKISFIDDYMPRIKHLTFHVRNKREIDFMSPQHPMLPTAFPGPV